jgi:kynureninase
VCRPGGIAGVFVHERHAHRKDLHRFGGWWGHTIKTRFDMNQPFDPEVRLLFFSSLTSFRR